MRRQKIKLRQYRAVHAQQLQHEPASWPTARSGEIAFEPRTEDYGLIAIKAFQIKRSKKMLRLIHIGAWLLLLIACNAKPVHSSQRSQNNVEKLFIRQLPQGRTLAYFEFVSTWDTHSIAFDQTSNGT